MSRNTFQQLRDAEIYGTATPMQWLEKRLKVMEKTLKKGKEIGLETEEGIQVLRSQSDFYIWCQENFPDAYACFFQIRRIQNDC
jgi:urease accessory protein UreE